MPVFESSYATTAGSIYNIGSLREHLQEEVISGSLRYSTLKLLPINDVNLVFVTGAEASEARLQPFTHPIGWTSADGQKYLASDLRLYVRRDFDPTQPTKGVKNLHEYNFVRSRAVLSAMWMSGMADTLKATFSFAGVVYTKALANAIAKAYALDAGKQVRLEVLISIFYASLFVQQNTFDSDERLRMTNHTMRITRADPKLIDEILSEVDKIDSIKDLARLIPETVKDLRLDGVTYSVLMTHLGNLWFGTQAKPILSVALEHPPTWIAVVHATLNERMYRSSQLFKTIEVFGKAGKADEFLKNYRHLVGSYEDSSATSLTMGM